MSRHRSRVTRPRTMLLVVFPWCCFLQTVAASDFSTEPVAVERDFGNSVRQMVQAQTLNPAAAAYPDPEPVEAMLGEQAENVYNVYRSDVAKPGEVQQTINFNVFSGGD